MELTLSHARGQAQLGALVKGLGSSIAAEVQDIHDIKYGWSVFENLGRMSAEFQPYYLAATMAILKVDRQKEGPDWLKHPHKLDRGPEISARQDAAVKHAMG